MKHLPAILDSYFTHPVLTLDVDVSALEWTLQLKGDRRNPFPEFTARYKSLPPDQVHTNAIVGGIGADTAQKRRIDLIHLFSTFSFSEISEFVAQHGSDCKYRLAFDDSAGCYISICNDEWAWGGMVTASSVTPFQGYRKKDISSYYYEALDFDRLYEICTDICDRISVLPLLDSVMLDEEQVTEILDYREREQDPYY